jgi:monoamine oxidase
MPTLAMIEFAMLQRRWDKETGTLPDGAPWDAKHAREWDLQTLETWIAKNLSTKASRAFARLVLKSASGAQAQEVSYLWVLQMVRSGGGLAQLMSVQGGILDAKFRGGAFGLAQQIANGLSGGIALSSPVQAISQSANSAKVTTARGGFDAKRVVVAVPPALCSAVRFENGLSPRRIAIQQRMPMGAVLKFHIAYETAFWRRSGYTGQVATDELPLGSVMEDTQEAMPAMLIGFAYERQARELSAMGADERRNAVIDCLVALFGPEAHSVIGYAEHDWIADEWSRGYVGTVGPGVLTQYGEALRAPCGRIHWASSETALNGSGYMEGALESGERAAKEILALT